MDLGLFEPLAIALGLGLLVGMQREWTVAPVAGIRTFPLITLLGSFAAILAESFGGWVLAGGLIALAILLFMSHLTRLERGEAGAGITTETAALVMYGIGAALVAGHTAEGVAAGGVVAVLLHWKEPLHEFVHRIGRTDLTAIMQLVLIALVILPVLPDQTYGWYDVLNPRQIWLMVVLIVGISLGAYVAYKLLGAGVGSILGGVLGGLISSTATTVSYSRRTAPAASLAPMAALVILLASATVYPRVLFQIGIVSPRFLPVAAWPLGLMFGLMAVLCSLLFLRVRTEVEEEPHHENPAQLKLALLFGGLYAVVLFAVAAVQHHFEGAGGLYVVAVVSGLTDVNAITLSTAEMINRDRLTAETGWRMVLVACLSNLVFKGLMVALLGNRRLLLYVGTLFTIALVGGSVILVFWPIS